MSTKKKSSAEVMGVDNEELLNAENQSWVELLDKIDSIDDSGANSRTVDFLKSKSRELRQGLTTAETEVNPES